MNKQIKIGFIGGCAITQNNVPNKMRFYSILSGKIKNAFSYETTYSFATYSDYSRLYTASCEISTKNHLDFMVIHLRPQPFSILSKLFIKYRTEFKQVAVRLNPLLYDKNLSSQPGDGSVPTFNRFEVKPKFMDINIFLGNIFSLHSKAAFSIYSEIKRIQLNCNLNKIQLIVLGIPYQPLSRIGNSNCKRLNYFLKEKLRNDDIEYLDCFNTMKSNDNFQQDNLHLSTKGHYTLGYTLFEGIKRLTTKR